MKACIVKSYNVERQDITWDGSNIYTELEAMFPALRCAIYEITEDIRRRNPDVSIDALRVEIEERLWNVIDGEFDMALREGLEDADDRFLMGVGIWDRLVARAAWLLQQENNLREVDPAAADTLSARRRSLLGRLSIFSTGPSKH